MKRYYVRKFRATHNFNLCDSFLEAAKESGFNLERIKPFGNFCFEYSDRHDKAWYYSYTASPGLFVRHKLSEHNATVCRMFNSVEVISIGTQLRIIKLEKNTVKSTDYLNKVAQQNGMETFNCEAYLADARRKRNAIIAQGKIILATLFYILSALFIVFSLTTKFYFFLGLGIFVLLLAAFTTFEYASVVK